MNEIPSLKILWSLNKMSCSKKCYEFKKWNKGDSEAYLKYAFKLLHLIDIYI